MGGASLNAAGVEELLRLAKQVFEDPKATDSGKALAYKVNDLLAPKLGAEVTSALPPQKTGPNLDPRSAEGRKNLRSRR